MDVFDLTRRLISIPSTSGIEGEVVEFIAGQLREIGFGVKVWDALPGRPNVYARVGNPDVVMSSHTDTVPPFFDVREDDEFIYGRGACDTKGLIAAMIVASRELIKEGVNDFGLLFVVGEEAGSKGAQDANKVDNTCRYLINGEPTESKLALGSKGGVRLILRAHGRAAHSAYPELGESAIHKLVGVLADLSATRLPTDPTLGSTTMNVGLINGGVAGNVIAPEAEAELVFRVVSKSVDIKRLIEECIAGRVEIQYTFECDPVFMQRLDGFETSVVSFTTDIPMLTNWGLPLLFGPGSILDAHTADEKISKAELARAPGSYAGIVRQLKERIRNGQ
ncbi:MAG TPA: M20/M25/M40 family metallo-hydrolase [Blastocatellia bacterium]|nr:M20/M25/M40 family metallo-hydrolase [Blastocatellia bacterium]